MKTLYIIRHAKSSWEHPDLSDFERPLNQRGKRDAPRMGKRLKEKNLHPDVVITSPARRALSTAKRICKELEFDKGSIRTDRRLYHADEETILTVIKEVKNKHDVVIIFGHNPGLTDFVNALAREDSHLVIDNIPTCGIVAFSFDADAWSGITWKSGKIEMYDYPKSRED